MFFIMCISVYSFQFFFLFLHHHPTTSNVHSSWLHHPSNKTSNNPTWSVVLSKRASCFEMVTLANDSHVVTKFERWLVEWWLSGFPASLHPVTHPHEGFFRVFLFVSLLFFFSLFLSPPMRHLSVLVLFFRTVRDCPSILAIPFNLFPFLFLSLVSRSFHFSHLSWLACLSRCEFDSPFLCVWCNSAY